MTEGKYDHLFTTEIIHETIYPPFKNMVMHILDKDVDFQIRFTHVSVPFEGVEPAHSHDFAQVMLWIPCTEDLTAFDAETELYLGEEGEKHIINKTTALFVPAGLVHCPIRHTRVGTPFFFVNCPMTPEYAVNIDGKEGTFIDLKLIPQNKPD
ncbi:hypothetical protein ACFLUG_04245 [Chloroflexota bacterium]